MIILAASTTGTIFATVAAFLLITSSMACKYSCWEAYNWVWACLKSKFEAIPSKNLIWFLASIRSAKSKFCFFIPAEETRPEADGELEHPHAAGAGHQEVPQLVHKDDDIEKGHHDGDEPGSDEELQNGVHEDWGWGTGFSSHLQRTL